MVRVRRSWRKLHIGVDADAGQIVASELTTNDVHDGSHAGPCSTKSRVVSNSVAERHPDARVTAPPRSGGVPSKTAERAPASEINTCSLLPSAAAWASRKPPAVTCRALAEATVGRFERVVGDGLRSRTDQRQATK